jgi:hypothetical protein
MLLKSLFCLLTGYTYTVSAMALHVLQNLALEH